MHFCSCRQLKIILCMQKCNIPHSFGKISFWNDFLQTFFTRDRLWQQGGGALVHPDPVTLNHMTPRKVEIWGSHDSPKANQSPETWREAGLLNHMTQLLSFKVTWLQEAELSVLARSKMSLKVTWLEGRRSYGSHMTSLRKLHLCC